MRVPHPTDPSERGDRAYEIIEERAGLVVPSLYRQMQTDGLLGHGPTTVLGCVHDLAWLTLDSMVSWAPPEYWDPQLVFVPFARTSRRDLWCWYPAWTVGGKVPVVLVRRDVNEAVACAPDFESFLLRSMLEQLACSYTEDLDDESESESESDEDVADRVRANLLANEQRLAPYIRPEWAALLSSLVARPLRAIDDGDEGYLALLDDEELRELLRREAPFARSGQVFPYQRR